MGVQAVTARGRETGQNIAVCEENLIRRMAPSAPLASSTAEGHCESCPSLLGIGEIVITDREVSSSVESYSIAEAGPFFGLRRFRYV